MTNRDGRATDMLDRAIAALRDVPVSEGPPPQLVASTVEALQSLTRPQTVRVPERRNLMFRIARYGSLAAAAAFLAVIAGWLLLMDRTAAHAFADVVQNVKNARSATFVIKIPTIIQGTRPGILRQKLYIQGDAYRMEIPSSQDDVQVPAGTPPILLVLIADVTQKKAIQLDFVARTAQPTEANEKRWEVMAKALVDPIKQLRQLKEQDAERIADEDLNGQKTQVYRLHKTDLFMGLTLGKGETAKMWVDPRSGLPVRIAVGDPAQKDKPFILFEEFTWNEVLDPALFKLEVPKGFTLKADQGEQPKDK